MAWVKGQSGNLAGRPSTYNQTDSLASTIRKVFTRQSRMVAIGRMVSIATADNGIDPRIQIQAFECLAKYGWPDERSGSFGLRINGKNAQVIVNHVHQPIGLSTTTADDAELPAYGAVKSLTPSDDVAPSPYAGVKLGNARHLLDSAPESPTETPGSPTDDDDPLAGPSS